MESEDLVWFSLRKTFKIAVCIEPPAVVSG